MKDIAEELPEGQSIESNDYSRARVMPVGEYVSNSRKVTGAKRNDGHYNFTLTFEGGLIHSSNGGKVYAERFPLIARLSTVPFVEKDFSTGLEKAGTTSSVAKYLYACGLNPKMLSSIQDIIEAMTETQAIPVKTFVGRRDKATKDEAGQWVNANLKTKDFKTGDDAEGNAIYADSVVIDGVTYFAKPTISSFSRV